MTYKEAKTEIEQAKIKSLNTITLNSNAPHIIEGFLIAPTERENAIEEIVFENCVRLKVDNETVLESMNLLGKDLSPFIIVLVGGNNICMVLDAYFSSNLIDNDSGKIS